MKFQLQRKGRNMIIGEGVRNLYSFKDLEKSILTLYARRANILDN